MDDAHPMYQIVYMDEASGKTVINMPLPSDDAPENDKDNFASTYFEKVHKKYTVREMLIIP